MLYVVTGLLSILDGLFVYFQATGNQLRQVNDLNTSAIAIAGLGTAVVGVATALWPMVDRRAPGSGLYLGAIGLMSALAFPALLMFVGQPGVNPGLTLNIIISIARAALFGWLMARAARTVVAV